MSDVEALRDSRYWAARAYEVGSATDVHDFDEAAIAGEASTDLHITYRSLEQHLRVSPLLCVVDYGSPSVGTDAVVAESAPAEMPPSDFEILDELQTPEEQIRRQIRAFRSGSHLFYRERLARRLEFLLVALEEEEQSWAENSPESLRQMILFLESAPELKGPTITVTPSATFRAQWSADSARHFAVNFLPDGQVRFVVFSPDPRHSDRVQRVSGIVSREEVMGAVGPYKVHRWATDAGT